MKSDESGAIRTLLLVLFVAYSVASLGHFTHNAIYLERYPNMPGWITRSGVYGAWLCVATVGAVGYLFLLRGFKTLGLMLIGVYGALGLDGLVHYCLAPISAHSFTMNFTIWAEVLSGAALMIITTALALNHLQRRRSYL